MRGLKKNSMGRGHHTYTIRTDIATTRNNRPKGRFFENIVKDLKTSNPSRWYSKLKRVCSYDQERHAPIVCSEIENLPDQEQADTIDSNFCKVRNKFIAIKREDIEVPHFKEKSIPQFSESKDKTFINKS